MAHLDRVLHRERFRSLVECGQLVVSSDGVRIARVVPSSSNQFAVQIADEVHATTFVDDPPQLLSFEHGIVVVFGKVLNGSKGLFRLTPKTTERVLSCSELIGRQTTASGTLVFVKDSQDHPEMLRVVAPFLEDTMSVHIQSIVQGQKDRSFLVLEPMNGCSAWSLHRYLICAEGGIKDLFPVPVPATQTVVGLIRWHDVYLLGLKDPKSSVLLAMGENSIHLPGRKISVHGSLEHLCQSPRGESFAWIARINETGKGVRQLVLNRQVIFRGNFSVGSRGIVWSANGKQIAAHLIVHSGGKTQEQLVSARSQIPIKAGFQVDEFCVDDRGRMIGTIVSDGRFSLPWVFGSVHDSVEYAWNMSQNSDGSVVYDCIISDVVTRITTYSTKKK